MWMKWQSLYNVAWYRCELKIQKVRDIVHKTNRFNSKKAPVQPRTVSISANYVLYIIHTGLCRVCSLLVFVHWVVWVKEWAIVTATGCKIQVVDPSRDMRFFCSLKYSRQAVGPPILLLEGYGDSSLGIKWPGHGFYHSSPFSSQG